MNKANDLDKKNANTQEKTDINTVLAKIIIEKNPELQQFLLSNAQQIKKFIENPKTQEIANNIVLNVQKLINVVSDGAFIEGVANFTQLPEKRRQAILSMSKMGWYPFEESIRSIPLVIGSIDEFMIGVIDDNYATLKAEILENHSERREILQCTFKLFEDGNDIAAIPLLLTQIDGITKDLFGMYYFTPSRKPTKKVPFPKYLMQEGEKIGEHAYDLLKVIFENANEAFISDGFEKLGDEVNTLNILNRNGILHGEKAFLNYWEKPNIYKVISLLLYVDWMSEFIEIKK